MDGQTISEEDASSLPIPQKGDSSKPSLPSRQPESTTTPSHDPSSHPEPAGASVSLDEAMASLSITGSSAENMFRALASLFQTSQVYDGGIILNQPNGNDIWTILHRADEAESRGDRDVSALRSVRGVLDQMLWARSQLLLPAMRIMADASRDPSWRLPFGEGGILNFSLAAVASSNTTDDIQVQALRLIGNSCADTDENRHRVVSNHYLQMIMARMDNPRLSSVVVPVVYNICTDYEPAQQQALAADLFATIARVLESNTLYSSPALSYACRLLDIGLDGLDPLRSPDNAVEVFLGAAVQPDLDVDDLASLADTAIAHLQVEQFQKHIVNGDLFDIPLKLLVRSYFPHANLSNPRVSTIISTTAITRDPDDEAELARVRKSLISVLSDVSALPEFQLKHSSLETSLIGTLVKWVPSTLHQLQLCACIVLGNLAQSDEICGAIVSRLYLHRDLITILRNSSDSAVVHSVLGFLRNLALPKRNKTLIGEAGGIEALTKFLSTESLPQVSQAAASLARQLVIGDLANTERLLAPLSTDEESPASSKTYLSLLLALFEKSDDMSIKTEVARIIAAILRCFHSSEALDESSKKKSLQRLYALHPNIGAPLGMMVSQTKYPIIRSEGWFAMALMARSFEGAGIINSIISEVKIFSALDEAIRGTQGQREWSNTPGADVSPLSPEQPNLPQDMKSKDRENAMILLNELLQHGDEDLMANIRRSTLEDLMQAGSQVDRP